MTTPTVDNTIARWARLGVAFGGSASRRTPDPERLLLDTARVCPRNARLFYLPITWLSRYSSYIARHRLKRLIETDLDVADQPALGALLALAIEHGASRELRIAARACANTPRARPLFDTHRRAPALAQTARDQAAAPVKAWNLWAPDQPLKHDALRPLSWIITHNPGLVERGVRKGDLRCSILETLRRDLPGGRAPSEVALAEACSANRLAVRSALDDLEREGYALRWHSSGSRNTSIRLTDPRQRRAG